MPNKIILDGLEGIKKDLIDFKKVSSRYRPSKTYYKDKLKKIKLKSRKFIKTYSLRRDIEDFFSDLISRDKLDSKDCTTMADNLELFIQDLELERRQEGFSERYYGKKSPFKFHLDIKEVIEKSNNEVFIVEPFVTDHILEITLKDLDRKRKIKILTNSRNADKRGKFSKLSKLFKKEFTNYEVRECEEIHDRGIFIDKKEGWVLGQSIKDAANNKPTYLVRLRDSKPLELIYNEIWDSSKKIH